MRDTHPRTPDRTKGDEEMSELTDADRAEIERLVGMYAPTEAGLLNAVNLAYRKALSTGAAREREALLPLLTRWHDTYGGSRDARGINPVDAKLDADTEAAIRSRPALGTP